jgi:hypothetical protein
MSSEPAPTRRPIARLRVSTVALLGVVAVFAVPAGALVMSGALDDKQAQQDINQALPVDKVVIFDNDSTVRVTGDGAVIGVTGHATLTWHSFQRKSPVSVRQQYANGVLTLTKVCNGSCGSADIDISVPVTASVQVDTSNAGIDVADVTGTVDLTTTNASISARQMGSGDAVLRTSNGGINASFEGAPKTITADTSNASVTVTTDGKTGYYDDVTTTNGGMDKENIQDRFSTNKITVVTTNAGVTIR